MFTFLTTLALLTLDDEEFFEDNPALSFAEKLPRLKDTVNVYGYPMGGSEQSVTAGIVSRIEYQNLFYDSSFLLIQIDAALNPGNSGGAAVSEGLLIGLVCSKIITAENIGFLVPVEEIEMFLRDAIDGDYEGQPKIYGILMQTVENSALRDRLNITNKTTGVLVQKVDNITPDFPLKVWDMITHIGRNDVDNEGRIFVHEDLRLPATYLVPRIAKGGKVPLTIIRDSRDEFICFQFENLRGERLVFPRVEIEAATEEILSDNGIRHQYSEDLKGIWKKGDF